MTDLLKDAQAAIDRKPTRDELRAVQDAFAEPATADDLAFGQDGGIGDPAAHALAAEPLTPAELQQWCKQARDAIESHEAGDSPNSYLLHLGRNPWISAAQNLAIIATRHLADCGGAALATRIASDAQNVANLLGVLPIILRIENWAQCGGTEDGADSKTDNRKKIRQFVPENSDVLKLAKRIKRELPKGGTRNDIARDFTDGDEKKAQSLLRQIRRFPHLLE
ncbi:MAG: hypothetical protein DCC68_22145 [Planctomycetota bacterium]|nr:MAG: hypothetical protein DCC68_22145 [Planctomycetota bacterium]